VNLGSKDGANSGGAGREGIGKLTRKQKIGWVGGLTPNCIYSDLSYRPSDFPV